MSATNSLKTYVVVEFIGYDSVDLVPRSWMTHSEQGDYVYWPKSGATAKVRRNEMPDKENWKQYPVRTFTSTDDYDRGVYLAKKAKVTSNLETEDNVGHIGREGPTKRKKRRPARYEDSDSGSNADAEEDDLPNSSSREMGPQGQHQASRKSPALPRPPTGLVPAGEDESDRSLPHNGAEEEDLPSSFRKRGPQGQHQASRKSPALPRPPPGLVPAGEDESDRSLPHNGAEEEDLPSSFRKRGPQGQHQASRKSPALSRPPPGLLPAGEDESDRSFLPHNDSLDDGLAWLPADDRRASTPRQEFVIQRHERTEQRTEQRATKAQDKGDRAYQLNVLFRLSELEREVKEGNAMMRTILSGLHMSVETNEDPMDPMDTEEEVQELEEKLKTNATYRKKMVIYLSSLGGRDMGETIRRMLRRLGTNKLWSAYSMKGRKNKKSFGALRLSAVIKKAYFRNNPRANERDIEDKIGLELKQAPFKKDGVKVTSGAEANGVGPQDGVGPLDKSDESS